MNICQSVCVCEACYVLLYRNVLRNILILTSHLPCFTLCLVVCSPRFFRLLLEAIKKRSAKLASIAVETRKATLRDKDHDGDATADTAGVCVFISLVPYRIIRINVVAHL